MNLGKKPAIFGGAATAGAPAAHNQAWSTITTTPTTLSGYGITNAQPLDSDLTALAGLSTTGLVARTGSGTAATRTITGTANQVIVTNGDGADGNPTLSLPQDIATTSMSTFSGLRISSAGGERSIRMANSNVDRWRLGADGTAESGGNVGSDFFISRITDVGGWGGNPIYIRRSDGYVGLVGCYNPTSALHVRSITAALTLESTGATNEAGVRIVPAVGYPGTVGTTNASGLILKTNNGDRLTISAAGAVRLNAYGAGTLVTDSSGNVTASSDRRLKNVSGRFTRGLDAIIQIQPKVFTWKPESGMNPDDVNVGFIAQDVQGAIPEAVGSMKTSDVEEDDGSGKKVRKSKREASEFLTLSDRPIIAALVNAVKELSEQNAALVKRIAALEMAKK